MSAMVQNTVGALSFPSISRLNGARVSPLPQPLDVVEAPSLPDNSSKTEFLIGLIGQVTEKMAGKLDTLRMRDDAIATLKSRTEALEIENSNHIEALRIAHSRAQEAEEQYERQKQEGLRQEKDLERLKQNIDRLMAIFNA